jgi:hypothetical protein
MLDAVAESVSNTLGKLVLAYVKIFNAFVGLEVVEQNAYRFFVYYDIVFEG